MGHIRFLGASAAAALVFAIGCQKPSVNVDGSSTVFPITEAVAEEFRAERPNVRVIASRSGTGGGFKKFSSGEIEICGASRPIKDTERQACEEAGVDYVELEVAFDGLAVVVNPANDWCDCLTVDQLKAIWQRDSAASRWNDLNPEWPDEEIELYGPGTDSGTFDYFTEVIVGEVGSSRGDYTQSEDDNVLVTGVAGDEFALGYFGLAYFEENKERLKLLAVDPGDGNCVQPTMETVRSNAYTPLSRPLFIYVRKASLDREEVRSFVEFYLSKVGSLVPEVGYVPVSEEVEQENRRVFEAAVAPVKPTT